MGNDLPDEFWNGLKDDLSQEESWEQEYQNLKDLIPLIVSELPDHYTPETYEGKGGTGIIIRVFDSNLQEKRVLKIPRPRFGVESEVIQTIENDIEKLQEITHRNIIDVYYHDDVKHGGRSYPFYMMDYIEGNTEIDEYLSQDNINRDDVLRTGSEILRAIEYLHSHGIIHQDIKPENILVKSNGEPVLVDFGFAKVLKYGDTLTDFGGTEEFMLPRVFQQVSQFDDPDRVTGEMHRQLLRDVGYAWDLWSMGLTLLYMHRAVRENNPGLLSQYEHKYIRLLACRMLDGENQYDSKTDLDLMALNLPSEVFEEIKYTDISAACSDWEKLTGTYNLESRVPEINQYAEESITASTITTTTFTDRVKTTINTNLLSRLGSIPQLGLMNLLYPTANHSRLEHAIGTFSLLCRYIDALFNDEVNPLFRQLMDDTDIAAALISALIQDIGQYPLAYDIKQAAPKVDPDKFTIDILEDDDHPILHVIENEWGVPVERVISILESEPSDATKPIKDRILNSIIKGPLGAERLDYLTRDSHHLGLDYAQSINFERFLNSLTIVFKEDFDPIHEVDYTRFELGIHEDDQILAETVDFVHYAMLGQAYWHHTHRGIKAMINRLVWETFLLGESSDLDEFIKFVKPGSYQFQTTLDESPDPMEIEAEDTSQIHQPDLRVLKEVERQCEDLGKELFELLQERRLFKRIQTFSKEKTERVELWENMQNFFNTYMAQSTSNPSRVAQFQREFQDALQEEVSDELVELPDFEETYDSSSITRVKAKKFVQESEHKVIVLVDMPPQKKALGEKINYLEEKSQRSDNIDEFEVSGLDETVIGGSLKEDYHESIGKLRIFCHPAHSDFVSSYFSRDNMYKKLETALKSVNT